HLRPPAGETSIRSAITRPTTGAVVHAPPNQRWTIEYHMSVVGRNAKPRMGQSGEAKRPSNHRVKNQRIATTIRGAISPKRIRTRKGIGPSANEIDQAYAAPGCQNAVTDPRS